MPIVVKDAGIRLTAILEPAEGVYVAFCPELDLATEGATPEHALNDLIEMALDYAEHYMEEYERFSASPNRAGHLPYIQALRANPSPKAARQLFS